MTTRILKWALDPTAGKVTAWLVCTANGVTTQVKRLASSEWPVRGAYDMPYNRLCVVSDDEHRAYHSDKMSARGLGGLQGASGDGQCDAQLRRGPVKGGAR